MKINLVLILAMLCSVLSYGQNLKENTKKINSKGVSAIGVDFEYYQFASGFASTTSLIPSFRYQYFIMDGLAIGGKVNTRFADHRVYNAEGLNESNREVGLGILARYYPFRKAGLFTELDGGVSMFNWKHDGVTTTGATSKLGVTVGYTFVLNKLSRFSFEPKIRLGADRRIAGIPAGTNTGVDTYMGLGVRYNFGKVFKQD